MIIYSTSGKTLTLSTKEGKSTFYLKREGSTYKLTDFSQARDHVKRNFTGLRQVRVLAKLSLVRVLLLLGLN